MSILLFLLSLILSFAVLWLLARFMGRTGLIVFIVIETAFLFFTNYQCDMFSVGFSLACLHFVIISYFAFYFFNKYTKQDNLQFLIIIASTLIFISLALLLIYSFAVDFSYGFSVGLAPLLIWALSFAVCFGVGFLIHKYLNCFKNFETKNFLNMTISIIAGTIVYVAIGGIGYLSFGNIMLQILITILWSIITLALLYLFDKLLLVIRDETENKSFSQSFKTLFNIQDNKSNKSTENTKNSNTANSNSDISNQENSKQGNFDNVNQENVNKQQNNTSNQNQQEDNEYLKKYFIDDEEENTNKINSENNDNSINNKRNKF